MASPQKYAAWTRRQLRDAEAHEAFARKISPDLPFNLPFRAVADGVEVDTRKGSLETIELYRLYALSEVATKHREEKVETPPPERYMVINVWTAKRIRNGVMEHNLIMICVENFEEDPKKWRKTFKQDGWAPRYRESAFMLMQSIMRSNYQFGFAEMKALKKLRELTEPHLYERYLLTGCLDFHGKDGIWYIIRKGRPTLSFRLIPSEINPEGCILYPLAAMCTHPAGYFARTWAGFLSPTDDVIAHLLWLRQSEHEFWKRCTQHPFSAVEAGI